MKLDNITSQQIMIGLVSAVVILGVICIVQTYLIQALLSSEQRVMPLFQSMFLKYTDTFSCNDYASLVKSFPTDKNTPSELKTWNDQIIQHYKERCT